MPWLPSYVSPPPPHTLLSPNKPSPRSARSCRPCRSPCSGPVAVGLLLSFLKNSPLLCCISPYSCYSVRNPPNLVFLQEILRVVLFLLLFCPGHGPPSALPANCPGFLHPSGTAGGGCGMGTLTPAPRSRWLCVRVAPYRGVPRLTSLVAGTTSSPVVRIRIAVGICYQGPRCPTRHPPRGSLPASCQLLFYCFLALAPAQLSPA